MKDYKIFLSCFDKMEIKQSINFISHVFLYWSNNEIYNITPETIGINNMIQVVEVLEYFSFTKKTDENCFDEFKKLDQKYQLKAICCFFKLISKNKIYKNIIKLQSINETMKFKDAYKKVKKLLKK